MKTCDRCGRPSEYSTCTLCSSIERERREDIEREEEARAERLEQLREDQERSKENAERIAEAKINPGEFSCPECLYRTLKYRAKRCPTCQASIGFEYWTLVDERKKAEAERAAERAKAEAKAAKEKWEREAPAREQAAREAAENQVRYAAEGRSTAFLKFFYAFLLPALCFLSAKFVRAGDFSAFVDSMQKNGFGMLVLFCIPVLNWIMMIFFAFFSDNRGDRTLLFTTVICWGLVGLVIGYAIRKSRFSK